MFLNSPPLPLRERDDGIPIVGGHLIENIVIAVRIVDILGGRIAEAAVFRVAVKEDVVADEVAARRRAERQRPP